MNISPDVKKEINLSPYCVDTLEMNGSEWKTFQDKADKLSPRLAELLMAEPFTILLLSVMKRYNLNQDQGTNIARIVRAIAFADLYIGDMPSQLASRLDIDQSTAREIASIVVAQGFGQSLEEIKTIQTNKFGKFPQASPPQNPASRPQMQSSPQKIPGEDLPETHGNLIDLRNQK